MRSGLGGGLRRGVTCEFPPVLFCGEDDFEERWWGFGDAKLTLSV